MIQGDGERQTGPDGSRRARRPAQGFVIGSAKQVCSRRIAGRLCISSVLPESTALSPSMEPPLDQQHPVFALPLAC